jgi:hypothetical protein
LEIIQEESEHATHSSAAATVRDFKEERLEEKFTVSEICMSSFVDISCNPVTVNLPEQTSDK